MKSPKNLRLRRMQAKPEGRTAEVTLNAGRTPLSAHERAVALECLSRLSMCALALWPSRIAAAFAILWPVAFLDWQHISLALSTLSIATILMAAACWVRCEALAIACRRNKWLVTVHLDGWLAGQHLDAQLGATRRRQRVDACGEPAVRIRVWSTRACAFAVVQLVLMLFKVAV